ncbi:MAG TPA: cellulase family glycosylhydrolase [Chitinophagaceae bacterium]|nr:cellulase family glycosylhydrolase [Chitinophagaceae bacterium]HRX94420.1 cellulase family glycosylhydrolase [Chitinophagaceae bacterium]
MKWLLILLIPVTLACKKNTAGQGNNPPDSTDPLAKGINLSNWFNDYSDPGQYATRFNFSTLQLIKTNGFTYVRMPVGSTILFNPASPEQLNSNNLAFVDAAVGRCITAGLAVTLNLHPWQNSMDDQLANDPSFADKLASYWKSVAQYFKKYPADKIFFEVYNEPHASAAGLTSQGYSWWQPVQEKLITAIREATADHFIIAGGEGWNSIDGLLHLQPYSDNKVIYNFHFYDPFLFTHQGASWSGWQPAVDARNVPYPSSPEAVAPLIAGSSNTTLNNALNWYGSQRYNIDSLDKWIQRANDWGQAHQVKLICNEFGSYKPYAPRQSRLTWIKDARSTFEKYKIGWAMWECDEGFGWISYPGGNRNSPIVDTEVLTALGL